MQGCSWYPFYVGDYNRKTAHLSLLEHGAYRRLIDHYMATKSPLPNDITKLYRICGARTPSERQAVLSTTAEFFIKDGTLLRNKRCDSEIDKQLKYSDSQSAKAKLRHSYGNAGDVPRARDPQPQPERKKKKEGASRPSNYYFEGQVIKLTEADFKRWENSYSSIPNLRATLQGLDDHYHVTQVKDWYVRCSNALANKDAEYLKEKKAKEVPFLMRPENRMPSVAGG